MGKRLVACLNQREGTNYTVREFFDSVYVPLFFGSSRMLQFVNNSPFAQKFTSQKRKFTVELMDECLREVHNKVQNNQPDASFFLGGPASGVDDKTSGQVTSMGITVPKEDIYASWIGAALGLTIGGGETLLIDSADVLLTTYDGWASYRQFLDQTPTMDPFKINSWNGQWVASQMADQAYFDLKPNTDGTAPEPERWVQLLFALNHHYRERPIRHLLAYVYKFGKTNETLGFVRLNLSDVRRLVDLYRQLFTVPPGMQPKSFEAIYETTESFRFACGRTEIGLRALKPKDVFKGDTGIPKCPKATDPTSQIAFDTYQTWIIAMLNNKDLLPRAEELAAALNQFQKQDVRLKNVNKQMVEELLGKRNRREFIEELTKLLEKDSSNCDLFERVVEDLLSLSSDNVPLFLTLLRFKYAAAKAES